MLLIWWVKYHTAHLSNKSDVIWATWRQKSSANATTTGSGWHKSKLRFTGTLLARVPSPLHWRHTGHDGISNHQPHDCLLNRLFRRRSTQTKQASKLRVTGLCAGNSPVTDELPAQRASNPEKVSIWWRHHAEGRKCGKRIHVKTPSYPCKDRYKDNCPILHFSKR